MFYILALVLIVFFLATAIRILNGLVVRQGVRQPMFAILLTPELLRSMREDIRG